MSRRLFWIAGTLLLALVAHLSYTLFGPRMAMRGYEASAAQFAGGFNRMAVLDRQQYEALFDDPPEISVAAVCAFDLTGGDISIAARFPRGPWTLTLYSARGRAIYAVNDGQAGTDEVAVTIKRASSLASLLGPAEETASINDGWRVETPETRGLAVLWTPLQNAVMRDSVSAQLRNSSCAPAK